MGWRSMRLTAAVTLAAALLVSVSCVQINTGGGSTEGDVQAGVEGGVLSTDTVLSEDASATLASTKAADKAWPLRVITQSKSNPTRAEILDAIRNDPKMGSEKGARFVVRWLAVQYPWAMFQGETEGNGTPIEALLEEVGGKWVVVDLQKTNGTKITAARYPAVPTGVFGPASFTLAARPKPPPSTSSTLQDLTNARGNPMRGDILDALRANYSPESPTFVVRWLKVQGNWAYFVGEVLPYQMPIDVVFKKRSGRWIVMDMQGEGDFTSSLPDQYSGTAPSGIFP